MDYSHAQAAGCTGQQAGCEVSNGGEKAGAQLHVGSQAMGFRRDNMEVQQQLHFIAMVSVVSVSMMKGHSSYEPQIDNERCPIQVVQALRNGLYDNWEVIEALWNHTFK